LRVESTYSPIELSPRNGSSSSQFDQALQLTRRRHRWIVVVVIGDDQVQRHGRQETHTGDPCLRRHGVAITGHLSRIALELAGDVPARAVVRSPLRIHAQM